MSFARPAEYRPKPPKLEQMKLQRRRVAETNRPKECTRCERSLDEEERSHPRCDCGDVICDECYRELYQDDCTRCCELFDKTDLEPRPGMLIGMWREGPCYPDDLQPGYYRVRRWPFYRDGMIEASFIAGALERVCDLDPDGLRRAEEENHIAGPMCPGCQRVVRKLIRVALPVPEPLT